MYMEQKSRIAGEQHGIQDACYYSDGEKYKPVMDCLCGWSTGRCDYWEDAGRLLDIHLYSVID